MKYLLLAFSLIVGLAVSASAQVSALNTVNALSNNVAVQHVSTNVVNAVAIDVYQGKGMSFMPYAAGTQSTNTGLTAFLFSVSQDGTTYTTTTPLVIYHTANGVTAARDWTNVPPAALDNVAKIKLVSITNALANMALITNQITIGRR